MFPRIRKILSVRQLLVLAVAVIIGPFWIINYEEWLKTRKLDQVLIETDRAMSEPDFWGSVMAIWDSILGVILQIVNSEYVVGGLVAVLIFAFAPLPIRLLRHFFATGNSDKETAPITERKYVSPFAGKTPAPPPIVPQEFINVLDRQDEHINGLIHVPHKWVRKHFDAPSPYIDINFDLANSSVYELAYENLQGRLFYRDDPIEPRPDIISHEAILKSGGQGAFVLRQFISADLRDLLVSQRGQLQELAPSENFCIRFSYSNRHGEKKDACWTILPELFDISEPAEEEGPDWNLSQAHVYWATVTDRSETFNGELEQAAFDENIDIWGKRDYLYDTVFEPIPSGHWIKSRLDIDPAVLFTDQDVSEESILEHSRTEPKNKTDLGITQYWYLKVSSKQIKERFG